MSSESVAKTYYKELKKMAQKCCVPSKNLKPINAGLQEYVEQNPDCTYDDILVEFGTPQSVVDEMLHDESYVDILTQENKKRKFMWFFIPIMIVFLSISVFFAISLSKAHNATIGLVEIEKINETTLESQ